MKFGSLVLLLLLVVIGGFSALNWGVFLSPTELSLVYTTVHMPLGLVMLGMLVSVSAVFLVLIAYLQGTVLLDARRHAQELRANRELTEKAETSRFIELRAFLEAELARHSTQQGESKAALLVRIDQLEKDLRAATEQSGTSLSAYIGQLGDRLDKIAPAVPER